MSKDSQDPSAGCHKSHDRKGRRFQRQLFFSNLNLRDRHRETKKSTRKILKRCKTMYFF